MAAKKAEPKTLVTADDMVVTLQADKTGKVRLGCKSWEDVRVLMPGDVLELRRHRTNYTLVQVVMVKRELKK